MAEQITAEHITGDNYREKIASVEQGLLLCHKKLCPHCKNMEKVIEKFMGQRPGLTLILLDSEEEPETLAALGAERVPTIMILKGGKVAGQKSGLMNPKELAALYDKSKAN